MDRRSFIRECVRTDISDDYENFDHIVENVQRWAAYRGIEPAKDEVTEALESLIADGEAEAYTLSAEPAKSERVTYSSDALGDLWFYVTPKGKSEVLSVLQLTGEEQVG